MITQLFQLLHEGGADGTGPEELADILWLARHVLSEGEEQLGEGRGTATTTRSTPLPDNDTSEDSEPNGPAGRHEAALHIRAHSDGRTRAPAVPIHVPAEAALPHSLELTRALRPLTRKVPSRTVFELDEEETVARLVDENVMVPVLRPQPSRWLTLTLVVDTGPSMHLWHQEVREFHEGLSRLGAFRDIRRWNLSGEEGGQTVALRPHPSVGRPPRHHREIVDPTGDQLILVLSDTVGSIWRTGAAERLLVDWARRSQVALAHLLPARLWNRGGATPTPVSLHIPHRGAPNARWKTAPSSRRSVPTPPVVPVPVLELEPRPLRDWAEMTTGADGWRPASSLMLPLRPKTDREDARDRSQRRPPATAPLPAEEALLRFRLSASPGSWELAGLLSALSTVTLPVARLVQTAMLDEPSRGDLAELFLGGILRRVPVPDASDGGEPRFAFPPGVRDALLNAQYDDDVHTVHALVRDRVSEYLEPRYGSARDFTAALTGVADGGVSYTGEPFALPSAAALTRLGHAPRGDVAERFLLSYAAADRAWAEWVAWQLKGAGYTVMLDLWSEAGSTIPSRLTQFADSDVVVALFSTAYFEAARWTVPELHATLAAGQGRVIPLRLDDTTPPTLLRSLLTRDLFGLDEEGARRVLLEAVQGPERPVAPPRYPSAGERPPSRKAGPPLPGALPPVWHHPPRNPHFVGRDELLLKIRQFLADASAPAVVVVHGPAGVGKTQLACEYVHRFAGDYDVVWWVSAEGPGTIRDGLARLAAAMGLAAPAALGDELRARGHWLLVFDDANELGAVEPYLPAGTGHVLIVSRSGRYPGATVHVGPLSRREAVALLRGRIPTLSRTHAERLAERLDDDPLSLAQAVAYLATTSVTGEQLLTLLGGDQGTFTEAIRGLWVRLDAEDSDALDFLKACALLAPEPLPLPGITDGPPVPGAPVLSSQRARRRVLRVLEKHALARVSDDSVEVHGLVFNALREALTPAEHERAAAYACRLLEAPYSERARRTHPRPLPVGLLPHLIAIAPADLVTSGARSAACEACQSLRELDPVTALSRLRDLHLSFLERLGHDHADTLLAASGLVGAMTDNGETGQALALAEDLLASQQTLLGEDHPDSLNQALVVASLLVTAGQVREAASLHRQTRERLRRVLGPDHPLALDAAHALAENLIALGRTGEANSLVRDTLNRRRRVLGLDHPDSVRTARLFMSLNEKRPR
ncbi:FxSxx-COOH system tetratricopeptide repeat protein [Streptomyces sp. NPDC101117]|uniref:FxSxx-COOH system tetratricopeptide repeat protein n=1 Tax=Streptomyces sp. NPDC101117 TaxID=3366108 RepID=UPI0038223354